MGAVWPMALPETMTAVKTEDLRAVAVVLMAIRLMLITFVVAFTAMMSELDGESDWSSSGTFIGSRHAGGADTKCGYEQGRHHDFA